MLLMMRDLSVIMDQLMMLRLDFCRIIVVSLMLIFVLMWYFLLGLMAMIVSIMLFLSSVVMLNLDVFLFDCFMLLFSNFGILGMLVFWSRQML